MLKIAFRKIYQKRFSHAEERSCKGGYHWVYYPAMDEEGFKRFIVKKMIATLMEGFSEKTKEALKLSR